MARLPLLLTRRSSAHCAPPIKGQSNLDESVVSWNFCKCLASVFSFVNLEIRNSSGGSHGNFILQAVWKRD